MTEAGVEDRTDTAEAALLARLRSGDERAFETLVERLYPTMLAVARHHVSKLRAIPDAKHRPIVHDWADVSGTFRARFHK